MTVWERLQRAFIIRDMASRGCGKSDACNFNPELCEKRCMFLLAVFEEICINELCEGEFLLATESFVLEQLVTLRFTPGFEVVRGSDGNWNYFGSADGEPWCEGQVICLNGFLRDNYRRLLDLGIDPNEYVYRY